MFRILCFSWAFVLGYVLFLVSPDAYSQTERRIVLAVGVNQGLAGEAELRFAEQDARRFAELLGDAGKVRSSDQFILTDVDSRKIENAFSEIERKLKSHKGPSSFFFYYSGHGDSDNLHIKAKRLSLKRLETLIESVPAQFRLSVIDACRGTTSDRNKGLRRVKAFDVNLQTPAGISGVVTLRSSSEGELSQESDQLEGAVFTHYLLTALRGAADFDQDKRITLHEAYTYAYRQTVNRSAAGPGNVMHPSVEYDVEGAGSVVLTQTLPDTVHVVLPKGSGNQYLVYGRPSKTVMAEVWSDTRKSIPIALPAGDYLIHKRAGKQSGAAEIALRAGETRSLFVRDFRRLPESVLAMKGGELRLVHHELRAGYGNLMMHVGQYGGRARMRYGVGAVTWTLSLGAELGRTEYLTESDSRTEDWLGGDLRFDLRRILGPFDLYFGTLGRFVEQTYTRADANSVRVAGYQADFSFQGFLAGPVAGIGHRFDLGRGFSMNLEVGGAGLIALEGEEFTFRPEANIDLDLILEF